MNEKAETFILDTNILIDFYKTDKKFLKSLTLLRKIIILDVILAEVKSIEPQNVKKLGFNITETEIDVILEANDLSSKSGLSFEDAVCFILSRDKGLCCVTNDKALYNKCSREGVAVLWGLELILRAFENKVIPEAKALSLAHTLGENNPKITEALIRQFEERLAEIKNNLCSI